MIRRIVFSVILIALTLILIFSFVENNKKSRAKRIDRVYYYSPDWMPDGKRIAYIKSVAHMKRNIELMNRIKKSWKMDNTPIIEVGESFTNQICILDLDTNKEQVILTITVNLKYSSERPNSLIGYAWEDNKYEGIVCINNLDVNPINGDILFDNECVRYSPAPIDSSIFFVNERGGNFKKIIMNGGNPRWSFEGNYITYTVIKETGSTPPFKYSLWIKNLEDGSEKKITDDSYAGMLGSNGKVIYYSLDKRGDDYSLIRKAGTYISDLDGSNIRMITSTNFADWTGNGNFILEDNYALGGCIYNIDGDKNFCSKIFPCYGHFSSDGRKIVGNEAWQISSKDAICIVNVDGSNFRVIKKNYEAKLN